MWGLVPLAVLGLRFLGGMGNFRVALWWGADSGGGVRNILSGGGKWRPPPVVTGPGKFNNPAWGPRISGIVRQFWLNRP